MNHAENVYGPIPSSAMNGDAKRFEEPDQVTIAGELGMLRGALESLGIRASQLVERIEPVLERSTDAVGAMPLSREMPAPTSKLGAEIRDLTHRAISIADTLAVAGELVRL